MTWFQLPVDIEMIKGLLIGTIPYHEIPVIELSHDRSIVFRYLNLQGSTRARHESAGIRIISL